MRDSERLEKALLQYFAQRDDEGRRFQTLAEISAGFSRPPFWVDEFSSDLGGLQDQSALKAVLERMVVDALLQHDWADSGSDSYRITDHGLYESAVGFDAFVEVEPSIEPVRVDAESWTGTRLIYVDSGQWKSIRIVARQIQTASRDINYESEEDQRDVQGLADALVALCEMAEPDVGLIERLLSHPKFRISAVIVSGIATLRGALGI